MTTTEVIFRKFDDGDIIAIFPAIIGDANPASYLSYMRVGQHSPAVGIHAITKPAKPEEYEPLKRELEAIGYSLKIVKRIQHRHNVARYEQAIERFTVREAIGSK